jgi:hypothetical protein
MKSVKKYLALTLIALALSCAAKKEIMPKPEPEPAPAKGTYFWAVKPEVNIRLDNTTAATKLGKLNDGDSVLVIENKSGWYQIQSDELTFGWIRSDLLGPRKVSVFAKAVSFVDSLISSDGTELFFDNKLLHRRIYVAYPATMYTSKSNIEEKTKKLVQEYQEKVYRGDVTARVLKPGTQDEYFTMNIRGFKNPDILLPVLPFGILTDVNISNPENIKLTISTPDEISDKQLLTTARNIVSIYPITYSKVELLFVSADKQCRLWLIEDKSGEDYKVNHCPD